MQERKFCSFQTGEHNGNCELTVMRRREAAAALNNNEPRQDRAAQAGSRGQERIGAR